MWDTVLVGARWLGFLCSLLLIVESAVIFVQGVYGVVNVVNAIHLIVFGTLGMVAELRVQLILRGVSFLASKFGLGCYYLFIGSLSLDNVWWRVLIGCVCMLVGLIYILASCSGSPDQIAVAESNSSSSYEPPSTDNSDMSYAAAYADMNQQ